jgi:predicted regulator of Ras-like GTPase activity (Roadblock/LC7/MglB family)
MTTDSVPTAAGSALDELLEVSPQVDAAVILERDGGGLLASAPPSSSRMADRFGATCVKLLEAADQARAELGREPVAQVEVATPDGHVFVVADPRWIVAAVTDADPTVGLVFYDLKTALRAVREASAASNGSNGSSPKALVTPSAEETSSGDGAGDEGAGERTSTGDDSKATTSSNRWRRKKPS